MPFFRESDLPKKVRGKKQAGDTKKLSRERSYYVLQTLKRYSIIPGFPDKALHKLAAQGQSLLEVLDNQYGINRIDEVLRLYCKHKNNVWAPQVWSLESFCVKFKNIERFIDRYEEFQFDGKPSKYANQVRKRLSNYLIPQMYEEILLASIQASLNNYSRFIRALKTSKSFHARALLNDDLGEAEINTSILVNWYEEYFDRNPSTEHESYEPRKMTFSPHNFRFRSWLTQLDYTFNLPSLVKEIKTAYEQIKD